MYILYVFIYIYTLFIYMSCIHFCPHTYTICNLVGGFNHSEKYESIGMIIPKIWKTKHQPDIHREGASIVPGTSSTGALQGRPSQPQ